MAGSGYPVVAERGPRKMAGNGYSVVAGKKPHKWLGMETQ